MRTTPKVCLAMFFLTLGSARADDLWRKIPADDPATRLLPLIQRAQPTVDALPDGSTYNYIWAEHMMAWMVAERSGLMSRSECEGRLKGLLGRVADWTTHYGFYFDAYDPATGKPTSDNVYFQGWWLWALILTQAAYPEAAPLATRILSRVDYAKAGMIDADHKRLAADRNATTGKVSFYIQQTGDISGELRTAPFVYTWLTGDPTPWLIDRKPSFIDVGGRSILAVWHHFTFDPFFVHSCFPEIGYFRRSYDELVQGADRHRAENGMRFYATRMEPLEAWREDPEHWPNTEHRVAKPWTAWLTDPNAPVMEHAWIPGYGVAQTFDNWNFAWGYGGVSSLHPRKIAGDAAFEATFELETLPPEVKATKPPRLTRLVLAAAPDAAHPPSEPLVVRVNGEIVGHIAPTAAPTIDRPVTLVPAKPLLLGARNVVRLETAGAGAWRVGQPASTFRPMRWRTGSAPAVEVPPAALTVFADGQRNAHENPFAFLCRASGAFGNYPWHLLLERPSPTFGDRLVAWVGDYSRTVRHAHVIHNVAETPVDVEYTLSPWETSTQWRVLDHAHSDRAVAVRQTGNVLTWRQDGRQTVLLKPR
jgi:hypothetical protein